MTPVYRSLSVALLHCLIVLGVAGKYAYDRRTLPRLWTQAAPYDPNLPLRGRYVRLRLTAPPELAGKPIAYFLPEHAADPSRRAPGEELWVEVSVPKQGDPRPLRLAVKKDGALTPLDLR